MNRLSEFIFLLVVAFLGVEYLRLPAGLSIYKIVIVPLCLAGSFIELVKGFSRVAFAFVLPFFVFVIMLLLAYVRWDEPMHLSVAMGLTPFVIFLFFRIVRCGYGEKATFVVAFWSIPHVIALVLFFVVGWGEAFSAHDERFDGLHFDPNLMVIFVLASAVSKGALLTKGPNQKIRYLLVLGIVVDVILIALTGSRGGGLGSVISLVSISLMCFGIRKTIVWVGLFLVPILVVAGLGVVALPASFLFSPMGLIVQRIIVLDQIGADVNSVSSGRVYLWERSYEHVMQQGKFIGYTVENFVTDHWSYPHNTYIDAALDTGLPGFFVLVGVLVFSAIVLVRHYRQRELDSIQGILLMVSIWIPLVFLSCFSAKAFWFAVIVPYALSVRLVKIGKQQGGP